MKLQKIGLVTGLLVAMVILSSIAYGQEQGIKFENGLSWPQIVAKAKAENKFIFMDCYATWCGPCKFMASKIFTQKEVGDEFNAHFISVAVQLDRTPNDIPSVKEWYAEADSIHERFKIHSYPTYLFFSPDGEVVHRTVGAANTAAQFISESAEAFDPAKQYYTLIKQWKMHKEDSGYLANALKAASITESEELSSIEGAYINRVSNPVSVGNIEFLTDFLRSSKDEVFKLFQANIAAIDKVMGGRAYVEDRLAPRVVMEELSNYYKRKDASIPPNKIINTLEARYPELGKRIRSSADIMFRFRIKDEIVEQVSGLSPQSVDWKKVYKKTEHRFPGYDINIIFLDSKLDYLARNELSEERAKTAFILIKKYGTVIGDGKVNDLIWNHVFNATGDKKILSEALKMMQLLVDRGGDKESFDTYANLLYKTGDINAAILWENKAIELAEKSDSASSLQEFKNNLEKMSKRQKTWEDNAPVSVD